MKWILRIILGLLSLFTFQLILFWLGILIYFPYTPFKERYLRITGPLFKIHWASDIPAYCKKALILSEDQRFYDHYGIDFQSLESIIESSQKTGKLKRGGSTITQQLIKNAFLYRGNMNVLKFFRKTLEFILAPVMTIFVSKDKQLDWYLNIVEFGPNIYGINEGSTYHFHKEANRLSMSECATLISLLPSPLKWKVGSPVTMRRREWILAQLQGRHASNPNEQYLIPEPSIEDLEESDQDSE